MAVLKAGSRLKSAVCSSELMVVVAPEGDVNLTCGGAPVIELGADGAGEIDADHKGGTQMGKRYTNEAGDIEVEADQLGEVAGALDLAAEDRRADCDRRQVARVIEMTHHRGVDEPEQGHGDVGEDHRGGERPDVAVGIRAGPVRRHGAAPVIVARAVGLRVS